MISLKSLTLSLDQSGSKTGLDNISLNTKTPKASELGIDDIPEAVRDTPIAAPQPRQQKQKRSIWVIVGLGAIALATSLGLQMRSSQLSTDSASAQTGENTPTLATAPSTPATRPPKTSTPTASAPVVATASDNLLGHLPYQEAPASELQSITPDGSLKLRKAAAVKYQQMVNAAAADGVYLVPISAFRSLNDQDYLFFDIKAERGQGPSKRAEVSAPPGYSEHHTGYAIDLGDSNSPETNLSQDFENTTAFKWLQANAAFFSFEISFPKNNPQGINYEPWHWRYVGDRDSLETFYRAHSLKK